jgi:hypothetical protein
MKTFSKVSGYVRSNINALDQFAPRVAFSDTLGQQLVELLACPLRGRYSRLHGDASSCRRRQPAILGLDAKQECIPVSLSSKF